MTGHLLLNKWTESQERKVTSNNRSSSESNHSSGCCDIPIGKWLAAGRLSQVLVHVFDNVLSQSWIGIAKCCCGPHFPIYKLSGGRLIERTFEQQCSF